jgi:hypothetical protein
LFSVKCSDWRKDSTAHYSENCNYTGVDEELNISNTFAISPNPPTDYIELLASSVILSKAKNPDIYIFDILGIEQSTTNLTPTLSEGEGAVRLNVSSLSPGVYFVRVGDVVRKFVKI